MNELKTPTTIVSSAGLDEKRHGKTGIWTFVLKTPDGKIIARSEWGTNYEFHEKQWLELPVVESSNIQLFTVASNEQ